MTGVDPTSIRLAGAVQLNPQPVGGDAPFAGGSGVVDVTERSFETEVLARSNQVPVVLDFWAEWCGPCKQLSPILEKLAGEAAGAWMLAKIDVDSNQQLAQAAQVQSIPSVKAVVNGQVVAEFTGALPENQVRQWITQLMQAVREGQFGPAAAPGDADEPAPATPVDPDLQAADDALVAGELDASAAAYQKVLDRLDATAELRAEARGGLARVALLRRAETLDPKATADALHADPADLTAIAAMADILVLSERAEEALTMLLVAVRRTTDEDRDFVRKHLLGLFDVLGDDDPLVKAARRELAAALF